MRSWWHTISVQCLLLGLVSITNLSAQQPASTATPADVQGSMLFASNCGGCHGSDGRGGEHAPDIATAPDVQRLADSDLIAIAKNGVSGTGMPAFDWLGQEKLTAIVQYLRTLQGRQIEIKLPGSAKSGEALFFGGARCSECHMVSGKGGFIGSDLSLYGGDESASQIRSMILDPERNLPPQKKATTVVTRTGQKFTGMLKVDDNFSVSIQTMDGDFHFFQKSQLTHIDLGSHSLMPVNYGSMLNDEQINDLVSYLLHVGSENSKRSPTQSSKSDDDDE
ncbi:c-type cytochrome [Alloacidobacterium dinghuense]|uniref:C-type cytochrome n=1 Tax=Alloacidobacterium dinghuense TaxID=2763107 RepID=A0A7G8BCX3_9BACT|nr:c-type cytochrome [Alloacidobacterium dinghuense]QNI30393.1 c-type cytochrome [Alloacidobacterium dinghuense]